MYTFSHETANLILFSCKILFSFSLLSMFHVSEQFDRSVAEEGVHIASSLASFRVGPQYT
jgi:hypothetical protein